MDFGLTHEFADLTWHPSHKKVVYRKDFRVPIDTKGDAVNDFIGFRPIDPLVIGAVRAVEESLDEDGKAEGKCGTGKIQVATLSALGNGLKNNDILFTGYPVIGFHHRHQTSGTCLFTDDDDCSVCAWDRRIHGEFFHQTTIAISSSSVPQFISDIKSLRRILGHSSLCNSDLYYGIILCFLRNSTTFLDEPDDSVSFDITYYRSHDPTRPRLNEDVWEEIEQMAVVKYGGRPHWGKNRPVAFIGAAAKYPGLHRFLAVKKKLDPKGLFSNAWSDAVLGVGKLPLLDTPGCALDGRCICSTDVHCAPKLGYRCRPGRVFFEARVCRHVTDDIPQHEEL
ncbi:hypothetical protein KP509_22G081900 [Ceratopteris richardii]|uniref:L-gulonolactone oxidase n=1 Tax=Ceratopteris richardii TaxID=49495 RepID=A0A8T2S6V3_CERRI|nr:hypothetical protein KP509_22G081900 [Ceratopteris richardii]